MKYWLHFSGGVLPVAGSPTRKNSPVLQVGFDFRTALEIL